MLFLGMGILFNAMLDIQLQAWILMICSLIFAVLSYHIPIGKTLSSFLLGMCIQSEAEQMQICGKKGFNLSMKGFAKGVIVETIEKNGHTQCIIQGYIDTPELPRIERSRILLRIQQSNKHLKEGMHIQAIGIASNPRDAEYNEEFNQLRFLKSKNIQFLLLAKDKDIAIIHGKHDKIQSGIQTIREWIDSALSKTFPRESIPLARGLLLGETSEISEELRIAFALLGTAHILSVSGFHAGIIALMILFFLSWIPSHFIRNILLASSLILFLHIVHWDPPAIRACMMTSIGSAIYSLQRKANPLHILLFIGGLMIVFEPVLLSSIGFQMSMMGMLGLIILPSFFLPIHQKIFPTVIAQSLSTSLSAMVILLPLTAWYFQMISLIGPLANLAFIPLFTIALSWTLISVVCFTFSISIAKIFAHAAHQMIMLAQELHIMISKIEGIAYQGEFALWMSIFLIATIVIIHRAKTLIQACLIGISSIIFLIGMHDLHYMLKPTTQKQMRIFNKNDVIAGSVGGNVLLMDRDIHRFRGKDKALIDHIMQFHKRSALIYSGRISKAMAISIQKMDSTFQIKECKRDNMKLCLNVLKKAIVSRE